MLSRRTLLGLKRVSVPRSALISSRWVSTAPQPVVTPPPPQPQAVPPPPPPPQPLTPPPKDDKSTKNASSILSIILASFLFGAGIAYTVPLSEIAKLTAMDRLPEPNTPEAVDYQRKLEEELVMLPLYQKLSNDPSYESIRAWNYIDSNALNGTITSGTLSVPGGFAIKPVLFINKEKGELISIVHVGQKLCGYPFLVHGGILASILDEVLKRGSAFKFGIDPLKEYTPASIKTNTIELQYKFPTLVNNFLVVKTSINEKGQVIGDIETLKGRLLVKALGEFEKRPQPLRKKVLGLF